MQICYNYAENTSGLLFLDTLYIHMQLKLKSKILHLDCVPLLLQFGGLTQCRCFTKEVCLSAEGRPAANSIHKHVFHSWDLELYLMTSIHEFDLNISKMYRSAYQKWLYRSRLLKVWAQTGHTDMLFLLLWLRPDDLDTRTWPEYSQDVSQYKSELLGQHFQKLEHYRQTDRQRQTHTQMWQTKHITMPHS